MFALYEGSFKMYDCSKEFSTFIVKVVLSAKEQDELRKRRKQNIRRIKDGLNEYVVIFSS